MRDDPVPLIHASPSSEAAGTRSAATPLLAGIDDQDARRGVRSQSTGSSPSGATLRTADLCRSSRGSAPRAAGADGSPSRRELLGASAVLGVGLSLSPALAAAPADRPVPGTPSACAGQRGVVPRDRAGSGTGCPVLPRLSRHGRDLAQPDARCRRSGLPRGGARLAGL